MSDNWSVCSGQPLFWVEVSLGLSPLKLGCEHWLTSPRVVSFFSIPGLPWVSPPLPSAIINSLKTFLSTLLFPPVLQHLKKPTAYDLGSANCFSLESHPPPWLCLPFRLELHTASISPRVGFRKHMETWHWADLSGPLPVDGYWPGKKEGEKKKKHPEKGSWKLVHSHPNYKWKSFPP